MNEKTFKENATHGTEYFPFAYYEENNTHWKGVDLHWHPEIEIVYWKSGQGEISINKDKYKLKEPCFFVINKEFLHSISAIGEVNESAIVFEPMMLSFLNPDYTNQNLLLPISHGEMLFSPIYSKNSKVFEKIKTLYTEIEDLYKNNKYDISTNIYAQLLIKSNLIKIIGVFYNNGSLFENSESQVELSKIKSIIKYINDNYGNKITIDELSKLLNLNPQYFCRFFKSVVGISPISYISKIRLNNSIKMILGSDLSITDIALNCGFSNSSHFIREFKSYTGYTPLQYKKLHLNKKS